MKNVSDEICSANFFENVEGCKLGFPAEIQVSGLYRKVREGSSLISPYFHQNLTTGSLVNIQKQHSPIIFILLRTVGKCKTSTRRACVQLDFMYLSYTWVSSLFPII